MKSINIVGRRGWFYLISILLLIPGIISMVFYGFNLGVEFQSGTSITYRFDKEVSQQKLRDELTDLGYKEAIIQRTNDNDYIVRLRELSAEQRQELNASLEKDLSVKAQVRDFYSVSPLIATETGTNAIFAVLIASIFMIFYIAWSFRRMPKSFRWGLCAVIALLHDVLIVMGVFSILGWVMGLQIDSLFISAMLTLVGFSIDNTIVIFDRVRENMTRGISKDFTVVVNTSIMETMARCFNTCITVLIVLTAIFLFGGATIQFFIMAMLVGVIVGLYDSICIGGALLVSWESGDIKKLFNRSSQKKLAEAK